MQRSFVFRDAAAIGVVALFLAPLLYWALISIQPNTAIFNTERVVLFDFVPTLNSYRAILAGFADGTSEILKATLNSLIIATGSTLLAMLAGSTAAYALSAFTFRGRGTAHGLILAVRILPPIALVIPLAGLYHASSLLDTRLGLILAHALMALPVATLLIKSSFDEIPREVAEAATIDGASRWQIFSQLLLPLSRGSLAATAILCFLWSWTEFLFAVFLTNFTRTLPVKLSIVSEFSWGLTAALSVVAIVPAFAVILLVQRHLVRGLTLGALGK